jgi:hypothetical protein
MTTPDADEPWIAVCRAHRRSVLSIRCGPSFGTGWIAGAGRAGFLLATARHVVLPAIHEQTPLQLAHEGWPEPVAFDPGEGRLLHGDDRLDLAVLLVDRPAPGPSLTLLHQLHDDPAQQWYALAPLGLAVGWMGFPLSSMLAYGEPTVTFCQGHISAAGNRDGYLLYCLDGNVAPGMSGAPTWDCRGRVMGMVLKYVAPLASEGGVPSPGLAYPGLGLVIPIAYLIPALEKAGAGFVAAEGEEG